MSETEPSLSDSFHRALGSLLVQANYLEDTLTDLYWITSGKTEREIQDALRGQTLGAAIKTVLDELNRRVTNPEFLSRIEALKPVLGRALELRNSYVHSQWTFGRTEMTRRRLPRASGVPERVEQISLSDIEGAIAEIWSANEMAMNLYDDIEPTIPHDQIQPRGGIIVGGLYHPCATRSDK